MNFGIQNVWHGPVSTPHTHTHAHSEEKLAVEYVGGICISAFMIIQSQITVAFVTSKNNFFDIFDKIKSVCKLLNCSVIFNLENEQLILL